MNSDDFKKKISSLSSHILFEYNGVECGVDPLSPDSFDMWFGDKYHNAKSIDEVMTAPLFNGKCINQIYKDIKNIDY